MTDFPSMTSFAQADAVLTGRSKDRRQVANNTFAERRGEDIAIKYHATDVVTYHPDGSMTLNTGGYQTYTTKDRFNRFTPFRVHSIKGRWFVADDSGSIPFVNGATLTPGNLPAPVDTSAEDKANQEMKRRIKKYVDGYTDEVIADLLAHAQEYGTSGDCWFCSMIDVPKEGGDYFGFRSGESTPNTLDNEHLLEHLDEDYRMISTLRNAVVAKGYRNPVAIISMAPGLTRKALSSYLRKRLVSGVVATR